MIRITAGVYKGRKLITPKGDITRPTSEKLRATLFNICQEKVIAAHFLDLFAGSGAMGLEALSRGARLATFIDQHRTSTTTIKHNIELLNVKEQCHIFESDALKALIRYKGPPFDLLYIDPPYADAPRLLPPLFHLLDTTPSLYTPGAWLFVEEDLHSPTGLTTQPFSHLQLHTVRKLGSTQLLHFIIP